MYRRHRLVYPRELAVPLRSSHAFTLSSDTAACLDIRNRREVRRGHGRRRAGCPLGEPLRGLTGCLRGLLERVGLRATADKRQVLRPFRALLERLGRVFERVTRGAQHGQGHLFRGGHSRALQRGTHPGIEVMDDSQAEFLPWLRVALTGGDRDVGDGFVQGTQILGSVGDQRRISSAGRRG